MKVNSLSINAIPRRDLKPGAEYVGVGAYFNTARWDVGRECFVSVKFNKSIWEIATADYGVDFLPLAEIPVIAIER